MRIRKMLSGLLAISALCLGASVAHGIGSVWDGADTWGNTSKSGTFNQIPAGAYVCLEAAAFNGSTAYASASGCGVAVDLYDDGRIGGCNNYAWTTSSGAMNYELWVTGNTAYSFVEISWGYWSWSPPQW